MLPILKTLAFAAALLVAATTTYFAGFSTATVALADVADRLREVQSLYFQTTVATDDGETTVTKYSMKEPGLVRFRSGGSITIFDHSRNEGVILATETKQAFKLTGEKGLSPEEDVVVGMIDRLRNASAASHDDLGPRTINGKAAFGFRVRDAEIGYDVWVDPAGKLPVRVELHAAAFGSAEASEKGEFAFDSELPRAVLGESPAGSIVMDGFVFDAPMDSSLFSLTPPVGYTIVQDVPLVLPSEEDLVVFLRHLATANEGVFPQAVDMKAIRAAGAKSPIKGATDQETLAMVLPVVRGAMFSQLIHAATWSYSGNGVRLGDGSRVVASWKPTGNEKRRAVFGDLTIRDVD